MKIFIKTDSASLMKSRTSPKSKICNSYSSRSRLVVGRKKRLITSLNNNGN